MFADALSTNWHSSEWIQLNLRKNDLIEGSQSMTKVMIPLNQKERRQSKLGIYRFYFRHSLTYGRKRLIDDPDNWNYHDFSCDCETNPSQKHERCINCFCKKVLLVATNQYILKKFGRLYSTVASSISLQNKHSCNISTRGRVFQGMSRQREVG